MNTQHQQEDSEINPRRQKHRSKHRRKGNKQPGPGLNYHVNSTEKMTRNRLTKFGLFAFGKTSTKVIRDPCVSEEHEARANADLNKILDLVNPSAGIIAAAVPIALPKNTVADAGTATVVVHDVDPELNVESRNGKKTRPIMSFGGYKLTESPMSLCPSASQETPSIDKLNVKPKHKLNWLQARVSKSIWSSSSSDVDDSSLSSSPIALQDNPAHYLPEVTDELFRTMRIKLDELLPQTTDYFAEKRQHLLRAHRQSVKQFNLSRMSTFPMETREPSSQDFIAGMKARCPLPDSQLPQFSPASTEHQGRGATKRGVLYAKFQIFDDPVEEPNNENDVSPRHHRHSQQTNSDVVPMLFCSDRRTTFSASSSSQKPLKAVDSSIEISLRPNYWYRVHLVEGAFSGRISTSVQAGWRTREDDVIHLSQVNYSRKKDLRFRSGEAILKHSYQKKREDPGKLNKPESEMNVLDYAEATPSGFDCPMQTTPTDASRVNRHLERSVRLHPLPVISPISIPPYESPEFKYYRHMLY